jgi:hypothetical protein
VKLQELSSQIVIQSVLESSNALSTMFSLLQQFRQRMDCFDALEEMMSPNTLPHATLRLLHHSYLPETTAAGDMAPLMHKPVQVGNPSLLLYLFIQDNRLIFMDHKAGDVVSGQGKSIPCTSCTQHTWWIQTGRQICPSLLFAARFGHLGANAVSSTCRRTLAALLATGILGVGHLPR